MIVGGDRMDTSLGEKPLVAGDLTVEAALNLYLEQVSVHKSLQAHEREKRKARQIGARLGRMLLRELTPLDLAEYRDFRLREASSAIVQGDLTLLEELFEVAVSHWHLELEGNPVKGVLPPRSTVSRGRAIAHGEMMRLLAACDRRPTPMLGWIVRIALQTAMSKEEILRVRKGDLNFKERILTVSKYLTRPMRQLPLSQEGVRVFQEALHYAERPIEEALLFYGAMGSLGIRRPLAIDKALRTVLLQARMKGFRFNDLRNEAMARMEAAGLTEVEICTLVGQPLPRTGKRLVRPSMAELVARLDAVGFGVVGRS